MNYTVRANQFLTDVALQLYGKAEFVFELAEDNSLEVTDDVQPGDILFIREELVNDLGQTVTHKDEAPPPEVIVIYDGLVGSVSTPDEVEAEVGTTNTDDIIQA
mgnify:CR=1 FL=1